jgi:hypothetical protein
MLEPRNNGTKEQEERISESIASTAAIHLKGPKTQRKPSDIGKVTPGKRSKRASKEAFQPAKVISIGPWGLRLAALSLSHCCSFFLGSARSDQCDLVYLCVRQ